MVRMGDRLDFYVMAGAIGIGLLYSAYTAVLRAPAVIEARPALADLGLWTALFSGRFSEWAFYHHALPATILTVALWAVMGGALIWATGR